MKMVKSLLLGSAAGLVVVGGAQAADLPVKAKPVEYVKVCSLYGAGFFYIPGTGTCLKIGGWVREEIAFHGSNSMTSQSFFSQGFNIRSANNDFVIRSRGYITADAREQTDFGTLRSYIAVGLNFDSPAGQSATTPGGTAATGQSCEFSTNRAFIQWAGFTFGLATSFFDLYSAPATAYWGSFGFSDTSDPGWKVAAYTAQFGNGVSWTISAEESRRTGTVNTSLLTTAANPFTLGSLPGTDTVGEDVPDIVSSLRVDQAWGSLQAMGALHDVGGAYYSTNSGSLNGSEINGHPGDVWGWAVGFGGKINTPFVSPGDYFQFQGNYTEGALRYIAFTALGGGSPVFVNGNSIAYGWNADGVFTGNANSATQTSIQLTTGWSVDGAYEHFWTPQWRTSLYGGYLQVEYNSTANLAICAAQGSTNPTASGVLSQTNCSNNWGWWWVGSRTQWNPVPNFGLGIDVVYQDLITANSGTGFLGNTGNALPNGTYNVANEGTWSVRFRAHRDFNP